MSCVCIRARAFLYVRIVILTCGSSDDLLTNKSRAREEQCGDIPSGQCTCPVILNAGDIAVAM